MKILVRVTVWLLVLSAVAAVLTGIYAVQAVRAARLRAERAAWTRRELAAGQVRELAYRDAVGRCGWCGAMDHDEHPARFHADEVAGRIQQRLAAVA